MVPSALSNRTSPAGRSPRLPPHAKNAMRTATGLEGCVVDNNVMTITALDRNDHRACDVRVAGTAALLVAKIHKIHERLGTPGRLQNKDAHDIYRMLVASEPRRPRTQEYAHPQMTTLITFLAPLTTQLRSWHWRSLRSPS